MKDFDWKNMVDVNKFTESDFWKKLKKYATKIGIEAVRKLLQLFYVMQKEEVPTKTKFTIVAALAYFILPIDLIPDFLPGGFTDDFAAIATALAIVASYIDDEVNWKADEKIREIFGDEAFEEMRDNNVVENEGDEE